MDWSSVGNLSSILGLIVSIIGLGVTIYTLIKVRSLSEALRNQSRALHVTAWIDEICQVPSRKTTLTEGTLAKVESIIRATRLFYVEGGPTKSHELASLLDALEVEIGGEKRTEAVKHQLLLIRNEITIR